MTCPGFADDLYALYALNLVQKNEGGELRRHLHQGCSTCHERIVEAAELWFMLAALSDTLEPQYWSAPSSGLRRRILQSICPAAPGKRRVSFGPWLVSQRAAPQGLESDGNAGARFCASGSYAGAIRE
jgi:hypothetical protein